MRKAHSDGTFFIDIMTRGKQRTQKHGKYHPEVGLHKHKTRSNVKTTGFGLESVRETAAGEKSKGILT